MYVLFSNLLEFNSAYHQPMHGDLTSCESLAKIFDRGRYDTDKSNLLLQIK